MMIVTSAPAKIILFGEHAVNRQQPALAAALGVRTQCQFQPCADGRVTFHSAGHVCETDCDTLVAFAGEIEALRRAGDRAAIRRQAQDFFAPAKYIYGTWLAAWGGHGAQVEWQTAIPSGSGLGSGAAAGSALALALAEAHGIVCNRAELAELAWHGDIIAHGGIASGLDTGASTLGGIIRYTTAAGPVNLQVPVLPALVIGDTGVRANTALVNARVNEWLMQDPSRSTIFEQMGELAQQALAVVEQGDWRAVGALMNQNQVYLREIGVSAPELETLIEAALGAGALGAKLSGAGGGGVMVALTTPETQLPVARAIEQAGGKALVVQAGAEGARREQNRSHPKTE